LFVGCLLVAFICCHGRGRLSWELKRKLQGCKHALCWAENGRARYGTSELFLNKQLELLRVKIVLSMYGSLGSSSRVGFRKLKFRLYYSVQQYLFWHFAPPEFFSVGAHGLYRFLFLLLRIVP